MQVKDIMTKNVYTLDENKDVGEAMRLMFTKKIHTIPIAKNDLLVGAEFFCEFDLKPVA